MDKMPATTPEQRRNRIALMIAMGLGTAALVLSNHAGKNDIPMPEDGTGKTTSIEQSELPVVDIE